MPDQTENYLFNMGIQGDDALATLRALLTQMRELNRVSGEMLGELKNISQGLATLAANTQQVTQATSARATATKEASQAATQHAAATGAEAKAMDAARRSAQEYGAALRSRTTATPGTAQEQVLASLTGTKAAAPAPSAAAVDLEGDAELRARYQVLAFQKWRQQQHMRNVDEQGQLEVAAQQRLVNTLSAIQQQREGQDRAALQQHYQWQETVRRANLERYERQRQERPIGDRERQMQAEWMRTGKQPAFDPAEARRRVGAQEREAAGKQHPFTRHLSWFIEGTLIYMAMSTAINAVRDAYADLVAVTEAQSMAQMELNVNMGMSEQQFRRVQELQRSQMQAMGFGATDMAPMYAEAGRTANTERELMQLVESGSVLSRMTGMGQPEAIRALQGILGQYQLGVDETVLVTDALAYAQRAGSDTAESYAKALERSGAAMRTGGYDLQESIGFLTGLTQVVARSGPELGMFLQQVFTMTEAKANRLRQVGIEPTGKTPRELIEEAATTLPQLEEPQQRILLSGLGGTRFMAETRAMLENYRLIATAIEQTGALHGESARRVEAWGNTVKGANDRAAASWQNYLRWLSQAISLEDKMISLARNRERALTAPVTGAAIRDVDSTGQASLLRQMQTEMDLNRQQQRQVAALLRETDAGRPIRAEAFRPLIQGMSAEQLSVLGTMMRELQEQTVRNLPMLGRDGVGGGMAAGMLAQLPEQPTDQLSPLLLLSMDRFTEQQATSFQASINRITKTFEDQGFSLGEDETRQIIVGTGEDFQLREISGATAAMEMHLRELRDQGRKLEGVWNLPGPGMVPLESIFAAQFAKTGTAQPEHKVALPLVFGGEEAPETRRLELPMIMREPGPLGPASVPAAPDIEEPLRLELPMIMRGLQGADSRETLGRRGHSEVDVLENKIYLNERVIAESTSVIIGDDMDRMVLAGGTYGSNLMSAVM